MLVYRSTVAAAIIMGALLVGCTAPDQPTDLRKDGPPSVTAVTVMSDLTSLRIHETATYCRVNDEKRPGQVGLPTIETLQVCPVDLSQPAEEEGVAEGAPPAWFVRIVFDMLLDPDIEDLVPVDLAMPNGAQRGTLRNTQPVTLRCNNVDVPYDGYYLPNGNAFSWPLGPDLFIQPISAISVPTGATCQVTIKDMVVNKDGDPVPPDQRTYQFKIGPQVLRSTTPALNAEGADDGTLELALNTPVSFAWTAPVKVPVDTTGFQIFEGPNIGTGPDPAVCNAGGTAVPPGEIKAAAQGTVLTTSALVMQLSVTATGMNAWKASTTYRIQFADNARVLATQGSTAGTPDGAFPAGFKLCFHTPAM